MEVDEGAAAVVLDGLTVQFSAAQAVGPVDLVVPKGSFLGLVGVNGSGKTTILRALCGLQRHKGTATVAGEVVRFGRMPHTLGAMIERPAFLEHASARLNLEAIRSRNDQSSMGVDELLARAGLAEHAEVRVSEFSHGMRQRLAIVRATIRRPTVLVLDEPANALDPHGHRWLRDLLTSYTADGGTVIMASHVLHDVQLLATHLLLLHEGEQLRAGEAGTLMGASGGLEEMFFQLIPERPQLGKLRGRG